MESDLLSFALPSLVQRIGREQTQHAKRIAATQHCQLQRIRRSRHWRLIGNKLNIANTISILDSTNPDAFAYLISKLSMQLQAHKTEPLKQTLYRLIAERPDISLAELMEKSDCTLAQARVARAHCEQLD